MADSHMSAPQMRFEWASDEVAAKYGPCINCTPLDANGAPSGRAKGFGVVFARKLIAEVKTLTAMLAQAEAQESRINASKQQAQKLAALKAAGLTEAQIAAALAVK